MREGEDVLHAGSTERIDALSVVSYGEYPLFGLYQTACYQVLGGVSILVLVNK